MSFGQNFFYLACKVPLSPASGMERRAKKSKWEAAASGCYDVRPCSSLQQRAIKPHCLKVHFIMQHLLLFYKISLTKEEVTQW